MHPFIKLFRFICSLFCSKCPTCKMPLFPWEEIAYVSSPSNVTIHSDCWEDFCNITLNEEPYKSRTRRYEELLAGGKVSTEEWKEFWREYK